MFLVLADLVESGLAKSGEVAASLKSKHGLNVSPKYASLALGRCYRRGFVSREPYKLGRVRGFIYELADKGAKWMLYKSDQWKNVDQSDRKPTIEVGKESIHPPSVNVLNQNQQIPGHKDFMSMEVRLSLPVVYSLLRANQSLKQKCDSSEESDDLTFLALLKARSDRDACFCAYWTKREARPHSWARTKAWIGISMGFEMLSITNLLIGIALKKEITKLPTAHDCVLDVNLQKPETRVGRGVIKTTKHAKFSPFAFPTPPAQILKIMAEPVEGLRTHASFPKRGVVTENSQEDDWTDFNSWWRHL